MTEKFDSKFHKQYVGGQGEVVDEGFRVLPMRRSVLSPQSLEEIADWYGRYVNDPGAELPEKLKQELSDLGKIKSNGEA